MKKEIYTLEEKEIPLSLREIPHPPKKLYIRGTLPKKKLVYLTVVGSRKYSSYGKEVCRKLIEGLSGYPIAIVSGLALGIDSIAHESALDSGLTTIAFPGSGLNKRVLYPKNNFNLSEKIIINGGCLISELEPNSVATPYTFPQRNRLMAGFSKAILVIEAEKKSGSLITARMGLDYNKDVMAVPGSIFSINSTGTNWLIKEGAIPIISSRDILESLGFNIESQSPEDKYKNCRPEEKIILDLLSEPREKDELIVLSKMETTEANILLSLMELGGLIKESGGQIIRI